MSFAELQAIQAQNEAISRGYAHYFRAKQTYRNTSLMAPPELRKPYFTAVPYVRLGCQVINERIDLDSFLCDDEAARDFLNATMEVNGGGDFVASAHLSAMEHGRSYLVPTGSDRDDGLPMVQIVPGRDMVHRINAYTGEIVEALQVFGQWRDRYVYWTTQDGGARYTLIKVKGTTYPDATVIHPPSPGYTTDAALPGLYLVKEDLAGEIPVFPLLCRGEPDTTFGRPEGKDVFTLQDSSCRIATDMAVASAAMGTPARALIGAEASDFAAHDEDGNPVPGTEPSGEALYLSRLLTISDPQAKLAEFTAAQLQNFSTGLNTNTRLAAAAMGVPQSVFGVASDANPASGDAVAQDDKRLVRRAELLTRGFTPAWVALGRYLLRVSGYDATGLKTRWTDPALPNAAALADSVQKLASITAADGAPLYTWQEVRRKLGDPEADITAAEADREVMRLQQMLTQPTGNRRENGVPGEQGTVPQAG